MEVFLRSFCCQRRDAQMSSMQMKTSPNGVLSQRQFLVGVEEMSDK